MHCYAGGLWGKNTESKPVDLLLMCSDHLARPGDAVALPLRSAGRLLAFKSPLPDPCLEWLATSPCTRHSLSSPWQAVEAGRPHIITYRYATSVSIIAHELGLSLCLKIPSAKARIVRRHCKSLPLPSPGPCPDLGCQPRSGTSAP